MPSQAALTRAQSCRQMQAALDRLDRNLSAVRTGRAAPGGQLPLIELLMQTQAHTAFALMPIIPEPWRLERIDVRPGLLEHLPVQAYGDSMSLQSLASVSVQDAQTLLVTPFDPQVISAKPQQFKLCKASNAPLHTCWMRSSCIGDATEPESEHDLVLLHECDKKALLTTVHHTFGWLQSRYQHLCVRWH